MRPWRRGYNVWACMLRAALHPGQDVWVCPREAEGKAEREGRGPGPEDQPCSGCRTVSDEQGLQEDNERGLLGGETGNMASFRKRDATSCLGVCL